MKRTWRHGLVALATIGLLLPAGAATAQDGGSDGNGDGSEGAPGGEIVGGGPADPGEYPYQVGLLQRGVANRFQAQFCAGSLISPDTVLTAAHCVDGARARDLDVLVGTHTLAQGGGGQRVPVRRIRMHPGWNDRTYRNDLAILQLPDEVVGPAPVRTIQPGEAGLWAPGTSMTVTGWGSLVGAPARPQFPLLLQEVEVPRVPDDRCRNRLGREFSARTMLCAGVLIGGGRDACQGDSGGPIVVDDGGQRVQVGIVSWGIGCARAAYPGVYTRLAAYSGFVNPYLDPDTAPDRVRRVTKRGLTATSVRVGWSPPAFDGGTAVTGYVLRIPSLGRERTLSPTQRTVTVGGLPRGATTVEIVAVNPLGESAPRRVVVRR